MEDLLSQIAKWTDKAEKERHEKVIADFMREIGKDLKRMHEIEDIIEPEKVKKQKIAIYGFLESMHMKKIEAARNQTLEYLRIQDEQEKVSAHLEALLNKKQYSEASAAIKAYYRDSLRVADLVNQAATEQLNLQLHQAYENQSKAQSLDNSRRQVLNFLEGILIETTTAEAE
jgi:nucleoid-associated protein YejK